MIGSLKDKWTWVPCENVGLHRKFYIEKITCNCFDSASYYILRKHRFDILRHPVGFEFDKICEHVDGTSFTKFKERGHSEMKISSIIWFTLLIMPIVLIFFRPLYLAGRRGYGKMMQVQMV